LLFGDLETPPERQPAERLVATGFGGTFVTDDDGTGRVLFVRDGALMALPIDMTSLQARGEAATVTQSVGSFLDTAFFTASRDVLMYRGPAPDYQLTWIDRRGTVISKVSDPAAYADLDLAPDGNRIVVGRENRLNRAERDLWIVDAARNVTTRFTSDTEIEGTPSWSPDGAHVWFADGASGGGIRRKAVTGARASEVVLSTASFPINPALTALRPTADGRFLIFTVNKFGSTKDDVWALPLPGGKPQPLIQDDFDQSDASVSPDGQWIAYVSNESGITDVFVRRFSVDAAGVASSSAPALVSRGGGLAPRWRNDSKELFYRSRDGVVMGVSVRGEEFAEPTQLFGAAGALSSWSVSRDGQRFLMALPTRSVQQTFTVVLNWRSALVP
jgi:dipeptidyl aminopeptidase/acylaminoacyl peptidase